MHRHSRFTQVFPTNPTSFSENIFCCVQSFCKFLASQLKHSQDTHTQLLNPQHSSFLSNLSPRRRFDQAMSIPMELMSIRNPNSTLLYRAHSRSPVTLCSASRSLRFRSPKFARADVSFTGLRFGFSSPYCREVLLNRSVVAFAASHEDSVSSVSAQNF